MPESLRGDDDRTTGGEAAQALKAIALYLPQFHPIPENDRWWGKGFTEWRGVANARPSFRGHYQPHIPADLGYYDLRLPETRQAQATMAKAHGVTGFCYYHYWFSGQRLLERPFAEVLRSCEPDFPFCLCWANEPWTRAWDGRSREVLMPQSYSEEDSRAHLRSLVPALLDPRYIRISGRPFLTIYRARSIPSPERTVDAFRDEARKAGVGELFLCSTESVLEERGDPRALGFDAAIEMAPDWQMLKQQVRHRWWWRWADTFHLYRLAGIEHPHVFDYQTVANAMLAKPDPDFRRIRCVTPMWDNSARRTQGATMLTGSTPALYERWLREIVRREVASHPGEPVVFINAWNEWGEGCHLEPDVKHGLAYLEATQRALSAT